MAAATAESVSTNPLLQRELPIPFDRIAPEHVVPAIRQALAQAERELEAMASDGAPRSYASTIWRLEEVGERLARVIRPVAHLTGVMSSPELRAAYETVLPEFSAFFARIPLNPELWKAVCDFAATDEARALTGIRARHLEKTVRAFVRRMLSWCRRHPGRSRCCRRRHPGQPTRTSGGRRAIRAASTTCCPRPSA